MTYDKDRIIFLLLALFIGGFGAHWFYAERTTRAIVYLVFFWTGIPALLALIDILRFGLSEKSFEYVLRKS